MPTHVPNVLAARYASVDMADLWSPERKVVLERELWLAVLEAQADLGVELPDGVVEAYRSVVDVVDLASIEDRERVTRHDVKARIDEFCALAGHEQIHKAMTSRDLTENVEQLQVRRALELVRSRHGGGAGPVGRACRRRGPGGGHRAHAQRARPGDHDGEALRQRRRGAAPGLRARRRPARAVSPAGHQGPGGHPTGHARPPRRRPRPARRPRGTGRRPPRVLDRADQRGPGLPPVARPRRRLRARPGGRRARPASP